MPVFSDTMTQYLDTVEIQIIMSVLRIIDNPLQDIPLVTVLRSMIGGFDDNDLVKIRYCSKKNTFYEAMLEYEEEDELKHKILQFVRKVDDWRKKQEYLSLDELIWQIYLDTGYYNYVSLMPNGALRTANLKMLFERAKQYEKASFKGLFNFINFIEKLKTSSGDLGAAKLIGENENVIRIMSIHKSKGLEFPIVFVCGMGKKFNMQDLNDSILLHQDLGLGPKYIDYNRKIEYSTLAKEAIKQKVMIETISEEMRILYVALTRSKEKLILTGICKDITKALNEKQELLEMYKSNCDKIDRNIVKRYKSYLDWIQLVYLNHKPHIEETLNVTVHSKEEILSNIKQKNEQTKLQDDIKQIKNDNITKEEREKIIKQLNWKYDFALSSKIQTKTSVTSIKQKENSLELEKEKLDKQIHDKIVKVPKFLKGEIKITKARIGTLMHMCLQRLDEKKEYTKEDIKSMIQNMMENELITENESSVIDVDKIYEFTKSELFIELKKAKKVYKEQPFYINLPAKEIYNEQIEENIIVQGIIDLYYINQYGEIVLVDYKTDYVKDEKELIDKYKKQLEIYKDAIENALQKEVKEVYIYSIYLQKQIPVI